MIYNNFGNLSITLFSNILFTRTILCKVCVMITTNFPFGQCHLQNHSGFVFVVAEKFLVDQCFSNHQQTLASDSSHSSFSLFFFRISSNFIVNNDSKQKLTGCGDGRLIFCEAFFSKPSTLAPTFAPCQQILQADCTAMCLDQLTFRSQH